MMIPRQTQPPISHERTHDHTRTHRNVNSQRQDMQNKKKTMYVVGPAAASRPRKSTKVRPPFL
jgi:hypothetical protein